VKLTRVQLKQGDPTVYGRVGEEVLYFRARGFEPVVIPGVSSALAGPAFAGISATQRGSAESVVLCTGVGRGGTALRLPGYERGRTLLVLMGVARLGALVDTLVGAGTGRDGAAYPPHMPIAIVERASMPDQRAIFSTVHDVVAALESVGEQRPPGMIIVGWAVLALWGVGDMSVLDEDAEKYDEERVSRWLDGRPWRVVEGVDEAWDAL
jgi:uroporphyrin-III C-methyltransferase